jgi:hypothetical protein
VITKTCVKKCWNKNTKKILPYAARRRQSIPLKIGPNGPELGEICSIFAVAKSEQSQLAAQIGGL